MRKQLFILALICIAHFGWAQKYDYVWVRGTGGDKTSPAEYNTSFMDFKTNPPSITLGKKNPWLLKAIGCMSDSTGKLLFFTNLIQVFNSKEEIMINGDTINYGKVWESFQGVGYPSIAGTKIIPILNDSLYLMVYVQLNTDTKYIVGSPVRYAIIDPYFENGKGKVLQKDVPFHFSTTLNYDFVRHGNGKDWWLLICEWNVNENEQRYYRYILNENGKLDSIGRQTFPLPTGIDGLTKISYNGSKYLRYAVGENLNSFSIFDLDRCSGTLNIKRNYQFTKVENIYGFEFSPSGRYIYPSKAGSIYQIDLESSDPYLFIDTLAKYDGYSEDGFGSCFGFTQLTPNNEIIILPLFCNAKAINIIHNPNLPGQAADFEQHSIIGPNFASEGPQFPNYRLKELSGSPCDTIGFVNINSDWLTDTTNKQLCLIPTIPKPFTKLALRIYDQTGDNILEEQFTSLQSSYCLKTDNLLPGKYVWYMWIDDKKILKGSITVL